MKKSFDRRKHFVWIGNHHHPPNFDSLKILTKYIWPKINEKLPEAQLHIYGSKFNKEIADMQVPNVRPMGLMKSLDRLFIKSENIYLFLEYIHNKIYK